MAGSLNKVILIGNLGKDPELRHMQDGKRVVSFPLATSETWKDKATGERKEKTEWHQVVIFNERLGEVAHQYLYKGAKVYLEGQVHTRKWKDEKGHEHYRTEVILQPFKGELVLLDNRKEENPSGVLPEPSGHTNFQTGFVGASGAVDDEIPF